MLKYLEPVVSTSLICSSSDAVIKSRVLQYSTFLGTEGSEVAGSEPLDGITGLSG